MGRPLLELQTDSNGVLHRARETGYKTTSASGDDRAASHADGLTAAELQLDQGELPERFQSLDMAALRQILSPSGFKAPMLNDQLLAEWTGPRLRDALKFAKLNTAPGPSGLLLQGALPQLRHLSRLHRCVHACMRSLQAHPHCRPS